MKVMIPGFLVPTQAAHVELAGKRVLLRPDRCWPVFEEGAPETKGIEHLLTPIAVDYSKTKTSASEPDPDPAAGEGRSPRRRAAAGGAANR